MAGPNTQPIFSRKGNIKITVSITAANNTIDITTGTSYLVFTADATNGSFLREIRLKVNPSQSSAATVARFWMNDGGSTGTKSTSSLYTEIGIPATTTSAVNALPDFIAPFNIALPPGYKIYLTLGTAPGGTAEFTATAIGGDY